MEKSDTAPVILYIETATPVCAVCIARGREVLALETATTPNAHAKMLSVLIQNAFEAAKISSTELDAVCVSEGPGSYTGLRIGFSTAKGICYAVNIPLILVNTLKSLAEQLKAKNDDAEAVYLPALDARRDDVYWSLYDQTLVQLTETRCNTINDIISTLPAHKTLISGGTGAFKFDGRLPENTTNTIKIISIDASPLGLIPSALAKFDKKEFADLAYCEPMYLKEFGEK